MTGATPALRSNMKLGQLRSVHPSYDADTWVRYEALYRGGKDFRAHVTKFLQKNLAEPDDRFLRRVQEASYRSYVGPIVDYFASQLMAAPLTIRCCGEQGDEVEAVEDFYTEFKEDADGQGTDLVDLARTVFRSCLIKGSAWVMATLPNRADVVSKADWEAQGLGHARIAKVESDNIIDWEYGDDGDLAWVLTYDESKPRGSLIESRSKVRGTWRLYDRENVETFRLTWTPGTDYIDENTEVPSVGVEPHNFPRVPFVRVDLPRGLWLMNRVAEAQVAHFRLTAGLLWAINQTCYAMPIFKMAGGAAGPGPTMGTGYAMVIGQQDDLMWAAPPSAPFSVIADEAKAQKDEIYRVAQQMAQGVDNNAAAIGRSAQSKHADTSSTEICLVAYGAVVREALEKVYDLIAEGRGDALKFRVGGLDRFNLTDPTSAVENAISAKELDVPSLTFKKELMMHTTEALMPSLSQDKKDAIRKEVETGVEKQEREAEEAKKKMAESLAAGSQQPNEAPQKGQPTATLAKPGIPQPKTKELVNGAH